MPTEVRQSGGFAVTAQLTTPDGGPLGDESQLQVKSTAYGSISLIITIGAAALLGLLFLRRLVHFVLRRRRAARERRPGAGGPEGAAVPLPPEPEPGVSAGPDDERPVDAARPARPRAAGAAAAAPGPPAPPAAAAAAAATAPPRRPPPPPAAAARRPPASRPPRPGAPRRRARPRCRRRRRAQPLGARRRTTPR